MYRLSWRTAKPLEPLTVPGCDNGPVEGLLPASPLWFKTVREHLHSYGSYRAIILLSYQEFIYLSVFDRDSAHGQKQFFHFAPHLNLIRDVIQLHHFALEATDSENIYTSACKINLLRF